MHSHTHIHRPRVALEKMPTFSEHESTLLSKFYQSAPWTAKLHKISGEESVGGATREKGSPAPVINDIGQPVGDTLVSELPLYSVSRLHVHKYCRTDFDCIV